MPNIYYPMSWEHLDSLDSEMHSIEESIQGLLADLVVVFHCHHHQGNTSCQAINVFIRDAQQMSDGLSRISPDSFIKRTIMWHAKNIVNDMQEGSIKH